MLTGYQPAAIAGPRECCAQSQHLGVRNPHSKRSSAHTRFPNLVIMSALSPGTGSS